MLGQTLPYSVVILKPGPRYSPPAPDRDPEITAIIWKHGKRNAALRVAGLMPVICPVADGSNLAGVCVLAASREDAERIMSADPAVAADVLSVEIHPTRSFPGSALPAW